ncbi:CubicO group peptidase, beta-lactamase class C family [Dyadobacter soli]|uniref:CubicO group peptidase, beta-lactamase class C family n=1 Tax=Dyadobacter soli TaxID=659014 RepID=A0A1G7D213_9BACT|nr:serine hydrolase domain-containing protein [Dyadobacter soli]SDE45642.1 CubicO group peptidase, beta-lactamase class C family [Dyadobacter soli]
MFLLKQKLLPLLVILVTATALPCLAQPNPAPQTIAGLVSDLQAEMQKQHVAGMMLSIVTRDSALFSGGIGYADADKRTQVKPHHLFRQASVTKLFVALGVLKLVQNGQLALRAHLKDVAPEIPFRNEWEETSPVTIEDLLEHSTGFADKSPFEEYNFTGRRFDGLAGVKVFEKFMFSRWKPGERHAYSGVNYAILAYLIEKLSRQSLDNYLRNHVFSPLGMPDANVDLAGKAPGAYAQGYVRQAGAYRPVPHQPQYNAGYGSLNASAGDLTHALQAYLHGWATDSSQFLSADYLRQSETPHSYLSAKAGLHHTYAYGNEGYELEGRVFRGHRGAIGGFLSAFLYNREAGVGYAFSINTHNEAFYRQADALIRAFVTKGLSKPVLGKRVPFKTPDFGRYAGYYRLANPGQLYTGFLEQFQNTLRLDTAGGHLNAHLLMGGTMHFEQAESALLRFKAPHAYSSHAALLLDASDEPVFTDRTLYFTPISAFNAWFSLVMLLGGMVLLLSSIVFGLANGILYIRKRWPLPILLVRLTPALAATCILLIISAGTRLMELMKACLPMDNAQVLWMAGKLGFAVFVIATIGLLAMTWKRLHSLWLRIYLVLLAVSGGYWLGILMRNHWYW